MEYNDITFEMLGTRRQRPMYLSKFTKFRQNLSMNDYPKDPHSYTEVFLKEADAWINAHKHVKYTGLDTFTRRDAILGTTHQLDELHQLYGANIATYKGEYKYHRRLTDILRRELEKLAVGSLFCEVIMDLLFGQILARPVGSQKN